MIEWIATVLLRAWLLVSIVGNVSAIYLAVVKWRERRERDTSAFKDHGAAVICLEREQLKRHLRHQRPSLRERGL